MLDRRHIRQLPLLGPLIAACRPVTVLDTLVPKDAQSELAAADLAYGPLLRQRFDIYVPTGEAAWGGPHPLLLFIYGGAWRSGRKSDYRFAGRAFAARGYVTAVADYRLVPEVRYPDHTHPPEELYLVLSDGDFRNAETEWTKPGIGGLFHNPPGIVHAMRSTDKPLLAVWMLVPAAD